MGSSGSADRVDGSPWTEPTTPYWQRLVPLADWQGSITPPYRYTYPVVVDRQILGLPIRALPDRPGRAVASFIANQASLDVVDALASRMGELVRPLASDIVVGLPTLGMGFCPGVVRGLGQSRWVPMGYSRKYWYDEALATHVSSLTTLASKTVYLDPNQLDLVVGRRVLIVDDVVSTARTLVAVWDFLSALGAEVVGGVVAMRQTHRWAEALGPERSQRVYGVFDTPGLELRDDGWWPV